MISRSFTWYLLSMFFSFVVKSVKNSCVIRGLLNFSDFLSRKAVESGIYHWLGNDKFSEKYKLSVFYGFLERIWQAVLRGIRRVQLFVKKVFGNSFCLWAFETLQAKGVFAIDTFLAVFIGLMFVVPHEMWNNLYAFIAAMFFGAWTVMNMASGKLSGKSFKGVGVAILVFLMAIAQGVIIAYDLSDAFRIALFMLASIIIAYSIYASVDNPKKLVRFVAIILFFVSITAAMGVVQGIRGVEVDLEFVDAAANEGMPGRIYSTFANPNNFAELLILFLPLYVALMLSVKKISAKLLTVIGFGLVMVSLAMTYSRSCWVGFALATVIFVCLYDKRLIIPLIFVALIAIPFLPETIMNRIFTIGSMEDTSNSYRLYIWESCLNMMRDFGITGIGLGPESFRAVYPGYSSPVAITAPHSHMLYMELVIEMGILGALGFFAYIFGTVKKVAGTMRIMSKELKTYAIAGVSALGGIAFVCCAEYIWFYPRVMFAFWVIPGLLMAITRISKKSNQG